MMLAITLIVVCIVGTWAAWQSCRAFRGDALDDLPPVDYDGRWR